MKAYKVYFNTAGSSGFSEVLLVNEENGLEQALEAKTLKRFQVGDTYSKITKKEELPLSKVKLSDLSITEFLLLNQMQNEETQ